MIRSSLFDLLIFRKPVLAPLLIKFYIHVYAYSLFTEKCVITSRSWILLVSLV